MTEDTLLDRLDRLQGTRRMDRFMQWVSLVAGTIVSAAIIGLTATVIDLRSSTAISNTELRGAIDRLSERLEAANMLADNSLNLLRFSVQRNTDILNHHEKRLREIEDARRRSNPGSER